MATWSNTQVTDENQDMITKDTMDNNVSMYKHTSSND